jgi:levanase/fructan beta-fructosidase
VLIKITRAACKNDSCLVAIYTADQPNLKKESQFIAYSNDGGMTFTNYENNPVIDLHKRISVIRMLPGMKT